MDYPSKIAIFDQLLLTTWDAKHLYMVVHLVCG